MSLSPLTLLQDVASQTLPLNIDDSDQIDELRVLMEAGLIAAYEVRSESGPEEPAVPVVRILAVTGDGRRLLQHHAESPAPPA